MDSIHNEDSIQRMDVDNEDNWILLGSKDIHNQDTFAAPENAARFLQVPRGP